MVTGATGHRTADGRAGLFGLTAAPYKFVGGCLVSADDESLQAAGGSDPKVQEIPLVVSKKVGLKQEKPQERVKSSSQLTLPFLGLGGGSWAQWVGVLPGPVTGSQFWHRPIPRWRARWRQRVEMP